MAIVKLQAKYARELQQNHSALVHGPPHTKATQYSQISTFQQHRCVLKCHNDDQMAILRGNKLDKTEQDLHHTEVGQWNPKYGCKGTVTTRFALIARVAWQY